MEYETSKETIRLFLKNNETVAGGTDFQYRPVVWESVEENLSAWVHVETCEQPLLREINLCPF